MKAILGIVVVLAAIGLVMIVVRGVESEKSVESSRMGQAPPNLIAELRQKVFSVNPKDLGLAPSRSRPNVWGVVMEMGYPDASATLFSLGEGTTSLYFSSGGGIIGGGQHEAVRQKADLFLDAAEQVLPSLKPTTDYPLPKSGMMKFYVLTYSGIYAGEAPEAKGTESGSPLFPIFAAGNEVMTQLRLIEQSK